MSFLLFTMRAPLAAFGNAAVGNRRTGWTRPGRSAALGMVAAGMGIRRGDSERLAFLENALHYAVRTDAPGIPVEDYHTAQTPRTENPRFATRRDELAWDDVKSEITVRDWVADSFFTACLWIRDEAWGWGKEWTKHHLEMLFENIENALERPEFPLHLGRRAGPLGLPPNPQVVSAKGLREAFDAREETDCGREVLAALNTNAPRAGEIAWDDDAGRFPGLRVVRVERVRDAVEHGRIAIRRDRMVAVGVPE